MGISKSSEKFLIDKLSHYKVRPAKGSGQVNAALLLGRPTMLPGCTFKNPESLFLSFGVPSVNSLDITNSEGATIIHDMNHPLKKGFPGHSLVYDGGTMEHVFNVQQFMFNVNAMLDDGGLIIHQNPLNNFVNHGFYSFSPCLYLAFYLANKFEILEVSFHATQKVFRDGGSAKYEDVGIKTYRGKELLPLICSSRLVFKSAIDPSVTWVQTFFARKKSNLKESIIPQQPIYDPNFLSTKLPRSIFYVD